MTLPNDILNTTIFVTNLHCSSCVTYSRDTLRPLHGVHKVDVNLLNHSINIQHSLGLQRTIIDALDTAGFDIQNVVTRDAAGHTISNTAAASRRGWSRYIRGLQVSMTRTQQKHVENCHDCQSRGLGIPLLPRIQAMFSLQRHTPRNSQDANTLEAGSCSQVDGETVESSPSDAKGVALHHIAMIQFDVKRFKSHEYDVLQRLKSLPSICDIHVESEGLKIEYKGTAGDIRDIVAAIEEFDIGASLSNIDSIRVTSYEAVFSVVGMTCGSCVATLTRGLKAVRGVQSVNVSLIGNSATLLITHEATVNKVIKEVEDMGFECILIELKQEHVHETKLRTVEFDVSGMYCARCPQNIVAKLRGVFTDQVEIIAKPDLAHPRVQVRYLPTSSIGIRQIMAVIASVDSQISISVYHPPSMEQISQTVQRKYFNKISRHFLFTLVAAIPSFIIGVVVMALLPQGNSVRVWFEQSQWAGSVMRMDWAMFIITTPVMFYGAGIFHIRALKEIWSMWKPSSKVPVLRRLYRFGSMNLLISAGTSVAYFGSLLILILQARTPPMRSMNDDGQKGKRQSITYFDTVTFLTLFILAGKGLQSWTKTKAGDFVAMLSKLKPEEALLVPIDSNPDQNTVKTEIKQIPIDHIEIGDIVSIPRGARPPADGVIDHDGIFFFDESSLTGESKPVKKAKGDRVHTGSINISDPTRIRVEEVGGNSTLDQIIAAVRTGQTKNAPIERFAETVTGHFAPVITLIAVLTWLVWMSLGLSGVLPREWLDVELGGWSFWSLEFAVCVFVVACPCGLGLAAPTALVVGGGLAAKKGILVQGGGEAFQEASRLNAIVFDKTGTLTEGKMQVAEMRLLDEEDKHSLQKLILALATALGESSTHPVAKAVTTYCVRNAVPNDGIEIRALELKEIPGEGMLGTFEIHDKDTDCWSKYEAMIGNERQLRKNNSTTVNSATHGTLRPSSTNSCDLLVDSVLHELQSSGCSTAIFSLRKVSGDEDGRAPMAAVAIFGVTDPIRAEAPAVLRSLQSQGINVYMCTGDNPSTARAIAYQLGIPVCRVRAGALPSDKADYVRELQLSQNEGTSARQIIAFVGDGINDTPALAAADVSIALSSGSEIAMTSSSFILLNSDLDTVLQLVNIAQRVFWRVKLNFVWAGVYNIALVPVAAGIFFPIARWRLSPVWAAAAMAVSSISVVLSSLALRLPEMKLPRKKQI